MGNSIEWVRTGLTLLSVLISAIAMWFARSDRHSDAQKKAISLLGQRIDDLQSEQDGRHDEADEHIRAIQVRLSAVDEHLRMMPQRSDFDCMRDQISSVALEVGQIKGAQNAANELLGRINQHLMGR